MKRIILILLLSFSFVLCQAQVSVNFDKIGTTIVYMRFSNISYWVECQIDTSDLFNSEKRRSKISKGTWTDTFSGLKLGKSYYIRSRQIKNDGTPISNWSGVYYPTAYYPFITYDDVKNGVIYLNSPKQSLNHYNDVETHFWYDTTPDFNSIHLKKYIFKKNTTPIQLKLYENHDTFYYKTFVKDANDSLPWITVKVITDFKPSINMSKVYPCHDSTIYKFNFYYNMNKYFADLYSDVRVYQNNKLITSFNDVYKSTVFRLNSYDPIEVRSIITYNIDTSLYTVYDTSFFKDLTGVNSKNQYTIQTIPSNSIRIFGPSCTYFKVELQEHSDNQYNQLLSSQIKDTSLNSPVTIYTDWSQFSSTALRYRIIVGNDTGIWFNIPNLDYKPIINFYTQNSLDSIYSTWSIYRTNPIIGKFLEVELDINSSFNSLKKKTYLIRDSVKFNLESLFGAYNYVRCRLIDGAYISPWSNTVKKEFSKGTLHFIPMVFRHPTWHFNTSIQIYNGWDFNYGHAPNLLNRHILTSNSWLPDTFDFVNGSQVYYRLRRYTPIDTSEWTTVFNGKYTIDNSICALPKILHNGYQNNSDTFHLVWLDKDPVNSKGYLLTFGPMPNTYKGLIEVNKGTNNLVVHKYTIPPNWYFSIYPVCPSNKTNPTLSPEWFQINTKTDLQSGNFYSKTVFYDSENNRVVNLSQQTQSVKIYDQNGRLVMDTSLEAGGNIELIDLNTGIYSAVLINPYQVVTYINFLVQ